MYPVLTTITKSFKLIAKLGLSKSYILNIFLFREDDLKYLEFVSEVTNDVLDRGIFTNRLEHQSFFVNCVSSPPHRSHAKTSE